MNTFLVSFSTDWFMHQIVSAIIHSAIYGMAYYLFKRLSLPAAIVADSDLRSSDMSSGRSSDMSSASRSARHDL